MHSGTTAKIALQLGHSGPKGSTRVPWDGEDLPLPGPEENWPLIAASPQQYLDGVSAWARAMAREDMTWYLTDTADYRARAKEIGAVFREIVGHYQSAMTAVQVTALLEERAKVEIEVTAVIARAAR